LEQREVCIHDYRVDDFVSCRWKWNRGLDKEYIPVLYMLLRGTREKENNTYS
jgi:hypothetical protein